MYSVSIRNIENERRAQDEAGHVRAGDRLGPQDAEAHQRLGVPELPDDEPGEQGQRRREEAERLCRQPALRAGLRDRVDERGSPAVTSTAPGKSNDFTRASRLSVSRNGASDEGRHADRDVDEEDPLPAQRVGEDAAEQDARRGAEAADRAPDAERDVALAPFGERRREDRQRRGRDDRRAEPLEARALRSATPRTTRAPRAARRA